MGSDVPIMIASFPRAIMHMDADAFFTSVEQALNPELRGKAVVTGQERGIIACASYEAKALGIARGITLADARKLCPGLVILPSDYESYSLFSKRMFDILRRFTPDVEEYSIDEAFADISGMRRVFRCSYEDIARRAQESVRRELGITVSIGVSVSKTLAKLCSKFRKPAGLTALPGGAIHLFLQRTPLEKVWGFGPNTVDLLRKLGLTNALDYVNRPEGWAGKLLGKKGREIWHELRGNSVWKVDTAPKRNYATIMKSKTFTPPSADRSIVFAEMVRNVDGAMAKARRFALRPRRIGVVLRRQNFMHDGCEANLSRATASTQEAMPVAEMLFSRVFREGVEYRATLVALMDLESDAGQQYELFQDPVRIESMRRLSEAVDEINERFGRRTVAPGALLWLKGRPEAPRDVVPARMKDLLDGETPKRHLGIPRLAITV
jgi:DNA polymerase-4/DNA polymerase V